MAGLVATALADPRAADASPFGRNEMKTFGVVELRQYTLREDQRERLIALFERAFIESQAAVGAYVAGSFRDLDDSDRFVWLRGFEDMAARGRALPAFYGGPVWQANRTAANATMRDSDNVLLLKPASGTLTPPSTATAGVYSAAVHYLGDAETERFADFFEASLRPRLRDAGAEPFVTLVTEDAANNFPRLPVREREKVFVRIASHPSLEALDRSDMLLAQASGWRDAAPEQLLPCLMRKPERLRLSPTPRSALR